MSRLGPLIQQLLDILEWHDEYKDDAAGGRATLGTSIQINGQHCRIFVETFDETNDAHVYVHVPFALPATQYAEGCMLANEINRMSRHGRLEIDRRDGEIRFVVTANFTGAQPTGQTLVKMLRLANATIRYWMIALGEVCITGLTAAEAIAAQDRRDEADRSDGSSVETDNDETDLAGGEAGAGSAAHHDCTGPASA
jgi:hypothetical protein